ncbi:hypothetical protein CONPUDRAFT_138723 [Coniophora puteana RWD-64-598 SS2]|uniref:Signal peptidase complex subunit 2 n=1 Tax=Coniophora puteana (strain RWD-64-598) TaxID=741705 RepID=A0A5M3MHB1_CONPW|nr:uncharacterized protein CONPUDRAFT_138723 [Coniophora puteana RWD-64-598 SS2]EIW78447.1 hypothetical protein CONPUDRAFT_138723 [Coniophora puteana RWD-64-598 SS2]
MAPKNVKEASPAPETTPSRRASSSSLPEKPPGPLSVPVSPDERETVKINNMNQTDLKNACDDALKRYLSRPTLFKQIYLHTDVRLALGWAGVFVAVATGVYGYKVDFETAKPLVWAGFLLYLLLTGLQTAYAYFVEGDVVFVGKRKTFSKRIVTERITISSRTLPVSSPISPNSISQSSSPSYELAVSYVQSAAGGRSLLSKGRSRASRSYASFFDAKGVMAQATFEDWVGKLVEDVMDSRAA